MTLYWIYDLPNWLLGLLTVLFFNGVAIGGLFATRPVVARLLNRSGAHNDVVSWFFAAVGVFYGLAVGLIAVATWEDSTAVDDTIGKEAAALAGLYRDLDGYPRDVELRFETQLRAYAEQIVHVAWPAHRRGLTPTTGADQLDALENEIMTREPKSERERITHAEVIRDLDIVIQLRQARLQAVDTGLPAALWAVVLIGALLNFALAYLFWIENRALHVVLVALFATFLALLIFLTAAMDHPFRGAFSASPAPIQTVIDTVMSSPTRE